MSIMLYKGFKKERKNSYMKLSMILLVATSVHFFSKCWPWTSRKKPKPHSESNNKTREVIKKVRICAHCTVFQGHIWRGNGNQHNSGIYLFVLTPPLLPTSVENLTLHIWPKKASNWSSFYFQSNFSWWYFSISRAGRAEILRGGKRREKNKALHCIF